MPPKKKADKLRGAGSAAGAGPLTHHEPLPAFQLPAAGDTRVSLMSESEQHDLQALLDKWDGTIDAHEFEAKLQGQLDELEEGTAQAYLKAHTPGITQLVDQLKATDERLDEISNFLLTAHMRLTKMRESIAELEHKNNLLEAKTANHRRLRDKVDSIIGQLRVPREVEDCIRNRPIHLALAANVRAGEELQRLLKVHLGDGLDEIQATLDLRAMHEQLKTLFCEKAVSFLAQKMPFVIPPERSGRAGLRLEARTDVAEALEGFAPLIHVVGTLDAPSLDKIAGTYSAAMKTFYHKEIQLFFEELRNLIGRCPAVPASHVLLGDARSLRQDGPAPVPERRTDATFDPQYATAGELFRRAWAVLAPLCMAEQAWCQRAFFPKETSQSRALERCLDGILSRKNIADAVFATAEQACKVNRFLTITLLCDTEQCMQTYQEQSRFLGGIISDVQYRIKQNLSDAFLAEQVQSIEAYRTTKPSGILPCFQKFTWFIPHLEAATGSWRRVHVDRVYTTISAAMMSCLDRSVQDCKHAVVVRMENFHHFVASVEPYPAVAAALGKYIASARSQYLQCKRSFVTAFVREQFPELLNFFEGLEAQLRMVAKPHEVQFQSQFSRASVHTLITSFSTQHERILRDAFRAVCKQLTPEENITLEVWEGIRDSFVEQLRAFDTQTRLCYGGNEVLAPSPAEVDALFRTIAVQTQR